MRFRFSHCQIPDSESIHEVDLIIETFNKVQKSKLGKSLDELLMSQGETN